MTRQRVIAAGIDTTIGNHSFRATRITAYLKNVGSARERLDDGEHSSTRTTQPYDSRPDGVALDEVERVVI